MKHRRPMHPWTLFAAFALCLVVLPTAIASAYIPIPEIDADTTLTEDHMGGIAIKENNVTLDCDGYSLIEDHVSEEGIGVLIEGVTGVTVKDCVVVGFEHGVHINSSSDIVVKNTVSQSEVLGFFIGGFHPEIPEYESHHVTVEGCTALGAMTYPDTGFLVEGGHDITLRNNVATRNYDNGIRLWGPSHHNLLVDNRAESNGSHGIEIYGYFDDETSTAYGPMNNVLRGNISEDNGAIHGGTGFKVGEHSTMNLLEENQASRNRWGGFQVDEGASNNTITNNEASGNTGSGFVVAEAGSNNVFTSNESHRNGGFGFEDETSGGTGNLAVRNTYSKNHCTGNDFGGSDPSGLCQEEPVGLVNTGSGEWHLRHSDFSVESFYYGNPGDVPFMGDWDCNEEATPGLFRQSDAFAYLRNSNSQGIADIRFFFGNPSDIPLAGDFNGDGCDTLSIYRPSEARFYIINKLGENEGGLGAAEYSFLFGNPGDKPVVGDWDGDGIDEIGLHREATGFFYYRNTLTTGNADGQLYFGDPGDRFVSGDWGVVDGVDTPAMFRPSNSTFYFRHTLTQGIADSQFVWTGAGMNWLPVSGDFTLD